ncbi:hypothetical protein ACFZB4_05485 [Streptomyces pseudovenezuelae]|uniref:hypothetical protein n=1 Tax=Streptomyces pseudovenezuelae TaxID=67350 RepID=UPI0036EF3172
MPHDRLLPVTVPSGFLGAPDEDRPLVDPFPAWEAYGVGDTCAHEATRADAHAAVS